MNGSRKQTIVVKYKTETFVRLCQEVQGRHATEIEILCHVEVLLFLQALLAEVPKWFLQRTLDKLFSEISLLSLQNQQNDSKESSCWPGWANWA